VYCTYFLTIEEDQENWKSIILLFGTEERSKGIVFDCYIEHKRKQHKCSVNNSGKINTFVVFVLGVKDSKTLKLFGGFRISGQAGILTSRRNSVNQIFRKRGLSVCELKK
jgi:hypothetical protein